MFRSVPARLVRAYVVIYLVVMATIAALAKGLGPVELLILLAATIVAVVMTTRNIVRSGRTVPAS